MSLKEAYAVKNLVYKKVFGNLHGPRRMPPKSMTTVPRTAAAGAAAGGGHANAGDEQLMKKARPTPDSESEGDEEVMEEGRAPPGSASVLDGEIDDTQLTLSAAFSSPTQRASTEASVALRTSPGATPFANFTVHSKVFVSPEGSWLACVIYAQNSWMIRTYIDDKNAKTPGTNRQLTLLNTHPLNPSHLSDAPGFFTFVGTNAGLLGMTAEAAIDEAKLFMAPPQQQWNDGSTINPGWGYIVTDQNMVAQHIKNDVGYLQKFLDESELKFSPKGQYKGIP